MPDTINADAFVRQQYVSSGNLDARHALHARYSTNAYGWFRWLFDQFDLPERCTILELGGGTGALWSANLDRLPPGWQITLTDLSSGMVETARTALGDWPQFAFGVLDARHLGAASNVYDMVVANHMLYHLADLDGALAAIRSALRPGGRLYASTIGERHMIELQEIAQHHALGCDVWGGLRPQGFVLETGASHLLRHFGTAERRLYEDSLCVTEAEPLVAYLLSTAAREALAPHVAALLTELRARIAAEGAIHISKETGLFIARR
jgi:2-polyprenyl-3-methyl-5-hydroxy-6-metoxy-1,4-benzoquinol methylase